MNKEEIKQAEEVSKSTEPALVEAMFPVPDAPPKLPETFDEWYRRVNPYGLDLNMRHWAKKAWEGCLAAQHVAAASIHKNVEGGNDYLHCRDCGAFWDYRKDVTPPVCTKETPHP